MCAALVPLAPRRRRRPRWSPRGKSYEVEIDPRGEHDLLSIVQAIDDLEPTLDAPRALKVKRGRRLCHVFLKLIRELATLTGQEALDTAHILGVLVR